MTERRREQEIFDAAYRGLAAQGFMQSKASDENGCAYRGDGGKKCAVGHLIPDDKYKEELEGCAADDANVMVAAGLSSSYGKLALDIQGAHDGPDQKFYVSPDQMKDRLAAVAARHSLTVPQVQA